ncbi:MAG: hypothetical protein R3B91_04660 [Planctomycetaceae bacterium]
MPDFVNDWLSWELTASRAKTSCSAARPGFGKGRTYVSTDDIKSLAAPVLRHRIVTNFSAESDGITADSVIERLINETLPKRAN